MTRRIVVAPAPARVAGATARPEETEMTDDILARIDATIDGRCACGCGALLDPGSPSAWFAEEDCQRRWSWRQVRPADSLPRAVELTDLPDGDQVADFAEQHLGLAVDPWQREVLRRAYELPERTVPAGHTGPLPEVPPECYGPDAEPLCPHTPPHACLLCDPAIRPRPAPRPPWWRRALDRIRTDRKD